MVVPERCFETDSPGGTEALAEALGRAVLEHGREVSLLFALQGELGSGKTTFVRGLARGLGVREPVTSPTFTLMHEYQGTLPVRHFDAWMARRGEAFLESGAAELLELPGVAVIEWAERIEAWLPAPRLEVSLRPARSAPAGASAARDSEGGAGRRVLGLCIVGGPAPVLEALLAHLEVPTGVLEPVRRERASARRNPSGGEPPVTPPVLGDP